VSLRETLKGINFAEKFWPMAKRLFDNSRKTLIQTHRIMNSPQVQRHWFNPDGFVDA